MTAGFFRLRSVRILSGSLRDAGIEPRASGRHGQANCSSRSGDMRSLCGKPSSARTAPLLQLPVTTDQLDSGVVKLANLSDRFYNTEPLHCLEPRSVLMAAGWPARRAIELRLFGMWSRPFLSCRRF